MGGNHSSKSKLTFSDDSEVDFDHFQILRAIGKGSFGKVCIVQKKDSKKMYAMKYMNKKHCIIKDAVRNVLREIEILATIEHPFLVNLWFSFQDEEDMFMVVDLLLGGDLRYHIQQNVHFEEDCATLYLCEIALALDFLQYKRIIHRDIKPDNILIDDSGHVHLTDFNIATVIREGQLATSMSGTKPYIAPEVFETASDLREGYAFSVDWWSLGVCIYETLFSRRPFDIHSGTSVSEARKIFASQEILFSESCSNKMIDAIKGLLCEDPDKRIKSLKELKKVSLVADIDFDAVLQRKVKPSFVPAKDHLNCDPTFELEEMIIEARPLHKKKKRLSKQNSRKQALGTDAVSNSDTEHSAQLDYVENEFRLYNRERTLKKREMEKKEMEWQKELERLMSYETNPKKDKSKKGKGGKYAAEINKMISPTVTRRYTSKCQNEDSDSGALSPGLEKEVQRTLAEAGKLLAFGAVEPLVMLSATASSTSRKPLSAKANHQKGGKDHQP